MAKYEIDEYSKHLLAAADHAIKNNDSEQEFLRVSLLAYRFMKYAEGVSDNPVKLMLTQSLIKRVYPKRRANHRIR